MRPWKAGLLILALCGFVLWPASSAWAAAVDKPYFKVFGADVFAGGWFFFNGEPCATDPSDPVGSRYQAPIYDDTVLHDYSPPTTINDGAIFTYGKVLASGKAVGASSDFGAMAMGIIESSGSNEYGFASTPTSAPGSLNFANDDATHGNDGGLLAGATQTRHCIPDYFDNQQVSPDNMDKTVDKLDSGQYLVNAPGTVTNLLGGKDISIGNGKNIAIFVNGDVYLDGNIKYAGGYDFSNVPHFALVVRGNIYIDPTVSGLEGWYVAQPDESSDSTVKTSGVLWTCHDNNKTDPTAKWVYNNCDGQLRIQGAVTAKQINFLRTKGKLSAAQPGENAGDANVAETIDFEPEMIIGGPFFDPDPKQALKIQSLVSLPPIF